MHDEINADELQNADADEQSRMIQSWFLGHYEAPIESLYYDKEDPTGFAWMGLSQHDAHEVLQDAFAEIVPDEVIASTAEELDDVSIHWLQKSDIDDFVDDYFIEGVDTDPLQTCQETLDHIAQLLEEQSDAYLRCLALVGVIAALEAFFQDYFSSTVLDKPELLRRYVESEPEFRKRKFLLADIFERHEKIREEVRQHLAGLMWHKVWKVKQMYQATFCIEVPKEPLKCISNAVQKRHDILHRGGQTREGAAVTVVAEELTTLINDTRDLVTQLDESINPPEF